MYVCRTNSILCYNVFQCFLVCSVGQHILRKAYEVSDLRGKEKWVQLIASVNDLKGDLVSSKDRGIWRQSVQALSVELYTSDLTQWRANAKKESKAAVILQAIERPGSVSTGASAAVQKRKANNDEEVRYYSRFLSLDFC